MSLARPKSVLCAASMLVALCAPVRADDLRLTATQHWTVPVGQATAEAGALALRGAPGEDQAVVAWRGLAIDAGTIGYATVVHDGLAPSHQLSLYFRAGGAEHVLDFPRTARRATIALSPDAGWQGRVTEVGLVYGPAGNVPTLLPDNTLRIRALELEGASASARARAALTRLARIPPRAGSDINVLPGSGLVALAGVVLALGLVGAAVARGRARRALLVVAVFAFVVAEGAIWRQWLVQHRDAAAIAEARRAAGRTLEFDWQLVDVAARIRALSGNAPQRVGFVLAFEDPYVADRLKYHLLPLRAWRGVAAPAVDDLCVLVLTDREGGAPLLREETAFGPVVATLPATEDPECRWNTSPSPH